MIIEPFSRFRVEKGINWTNPHVIISITDLPSDPAEIPDNPACLAILRMSFPDRDTFSKNGPNDLFSKEQARTIWNFVFKHKGSINSIMVHCTMGVSRSPGVAAALSNIINGDDMDYFKRFTPNRYVYRMLLEVWHDEFKT